MKNNFSGQTAPQKDFEGVFSSTPVDHPDLIQEKFQEMDVAMDFDVFFDPSSPAEKIIEAQNKMNEMNKMLIDMLEASYGESLTENLDVKEITVPGSSFETDAPEVLLRISSPEERSEELLPLLYIIHGGGFIFGSNMMDAPAVADYVKNIGCVAVQPEYRLAPLHKYPAAIEDCYAGLVWAVENASELGIDPDRVVIMGVSSGGTLAASLAHLNRDRKGIDICAQVLISPILDDRCSTNSSKIDFGSGWGPNLERKSWRTYLGEWYGRNDVPPYAAAGRALGFESLPPAIIHASELDQDRDDVMRYVQNLLDANVFTEFHLWGGGYHGFWITLPETELSKRVTANITAGLKTALSGKLPRRS
jgi:acetyl esterase/lipase